MKKLLQRIKKLISDGLDGIYQIEREKELGNNAEEIKDCNEDDPNDTYDEDE